MFAPTHSTNDRKNKTGARIFSEVRFAWSTISYPKTTCGIRERTPRLEISQNESENGTVHAMSSCSSSLWELLNEKDLVPKNALCGSIALLFCIPTTHVSSSIPERAPRTPIAWGPHPRSVPLFVFSTNALLFRRRHMCCVKKEEEGIRGFGAR